MTLGEMGSLHILYKNACGVPGYQHDNLGLCPDEINGYSARDVDCKVCQALMDLNNIKIDEVIIYD